MCCQSHSWSIFQHLCHKIFWSWFTQHTSFSQTIKGMTFFYEDIKKQFCKGCNNIKIYLKLIEVQCNIIFLSDLGVEKAVKNERKRVSRMWKNAYLSIKIPKASRALKQTLVTNGLLHSLRYIGNFRPQKLAPWQNSGSAPDCLNFYQSYSQRGQDNLWDVV